MSARSLKAVQARASHGLMASGYSSVVNSGGAQQVSLVARRRSHAKEGETNTGAQQTDAFERLSRHLASRIEDLHELCNLRCASDEVDARQRLGNLAHNLDDSLTSVEQQLSFLEESIERDSQILRRAVEVRAASASQLEKTMQLHSLLVTQLDPPPPDPKTVSAFLSVP